MKFFAQENIRIRIADQQGAAVEFSLSRIQVASILAGVALSVLCLVLVIFSELGVGGTENLGPFHVDRAKVPQNELLRVRKYESELRERAKYIDAILRDAQSNERAPMFDEAPTKKNSSLGLGGSYEPRAPIIRYRGNVRVKGGARSVIDRAWRKMKREISGIRSGVKIERIDPEQDLLGYLDQQAEELRMFPIGAPVAQGEISSEFGGRVSPFSRRWQQHEGRDYSVAKLSPVTTTADGVVTRTGWESGYGLTVVIDHGNGYETLYGHLSKIVVKEGDKVCRGMQIGQVGSTGRSTGPHVHYEVRLDGVPYDPASYVRTADFITLLTQKEQRGIAGDLDLLKSRLEKQS